MPQRTESTFRPLLLKVWSLESALLHGIMLEMENPTLYPKPAELESSLVLRSPDDWHAHKRLSSTALGYNGQKVIRPAMVLCTNSCHKSYTTILTDVLH